VCFSVRRSLAKHERERHAEPAGSHRHARPLCPRRVLPQSNRGSPGNRQNGGVGFRRVGGFVVSAFAPLPSVLLTLCRSRRKAAVAREDYRKQGRYRPLKCQDSVSKILLSAFPLAVKPGSGRQLPGGGAGAAFVEIPSPCPRVGRCTPCPLRRQRGATGQRCSSRHSFSLGTERSRTCRGMPSNRRQRSTGFVPSAGQQPPLASHITPGTVLSLPTWTLERHTHPAKHGNCGVQCMSPTTPAVVVSHHSTYRPFGCASLRRAGGRADAKFGLEEAELGNPQPRIRQKRGA
jgi:hypothetical protein